MSSTSSASSCSSLKKKNDLKTRKQALFKKERIGKSDIVCDADLPIIDLFEKFDPTKVQKIPVKLGCADFNEKKSPPWLQDDNAYLLTNILSKKECENIVATVNEFGFRGLNGEEQYPSAMRNNKRIQLMSAKMASILEQRVFPFMNPILTINNNSHTLHKTRVHHGTWKLDAINPQIRFYRYDNNNKFLKHADFGEAPDPLHYRTFVTCLFYLNDGNGIQFKGGATRLFHDFDDGTGPRWHKYASVVPETGTCFIMNQNMYHDGENVEVVINPKYNMRSDILYDAVEVGTLTELEKKAHAIYYEAMKLENVDEEKAAVKFIQAQEIMEDVNYLCS